MKNIITDNSNYRKEYKNMKKTDRRRFVKGTVSAFLAAALMAGMAAAPADSGFVSEGTVLTADAASVKVYDINSSPTYTALTKSKVTALYKTAFSDCGTYKQGKAATYYTNGKLPSLDNGGSAGTLTSDTVKAAQNAVNAYRTLAGLSEITLSTGSTWQAGALIRSYGENFKHVLDLSTVEKPAGYSSSLLKTGVECPNSILSYGVSPTACWYNWMSERYNGSGATSTGHRMFILEPGLKGMNFGYSNSVALASPVWDYSSVAKEAVSAYPSPGYMPTQMVEYAPAPWSVQLNKVKVYYSDQSSVKVKVTSPDGKSYTCTKANGKLRFGKNNADLIEFERPEISGTSYSGTYKVEITGLKNFEDKADASVKYSVKFYDAAKDSSTDTETKPSGQTGGTSSGSTGTSTKPSDQTGSGTTSGTATAKVKIPDCDIVIKTYKYAYTGKEIKLIPTIKYKGETLKQGTDYTLSYSNNINAGTASMTVTGKGRFTGTYKTSYTIYKETPKPSTSTASSKRDITSECKFYLKDHCYRYAYTGKAVKPEVRVHNINGLLTLGTDYTVSYSNCVNTGTATVTITGKGKYTGQKTLTYTIFKEFNSNSIKLTGIKSSYTFKGARINPDPKVYYYGKLLVKGRDYELIHCNTYGKGTARLYVRGKGEYKGDYVFKFNIV